MGVHGSDVASELGVKREEQDAWALRSQVRYHEALAAGKFAEEIVPVSVNGSSVGGDEQPRADTTIEKLAALRGAFGDGTTITAGNAPGMNDGATAVLLMSAERARAEGLVPLGTWLTYGESAAEHPYLATVPALAIEAALAGSQGRSTPASSRWSRSMRRSRRLRSRARGCSKWIRTASTSTVARLRSGTRSAPAERAFS